MNNQFEISAQKRTIYIQLYCDLYKFKLNMPKLLVKRINSRWIINAIDQNENICYAPLPNVYWTGEICLFSSLGPKSIINTKDEFLERFYNSVFTLSECGSLFKYFKDPVPVPVNVNVSIFYNDWEKTGDIKLIPC